MLIGLRRFGEGSDRDVTEVEAKEILVTVEGQGLCAIEELGVVDLCTLKQLEESSFCCIPSLTGEIELLIVPLRTLVKLGLREETELDDSTSCALLARMKSEDEFHVYELSLMFE